MLKLIAEDYTNDVVVFTADGETYEKIATDFYENQQLQKENEKRVKEIKRLQNKLAQRRVEVRRLSLQVGNGTPMGIRNAQLQALVNEYEETIEERDNQISLLYAEIARLKGDEKENNGN